MLGAILPQALRGYDLDMKLSGFALALLAAGVAAAADAPPSAADLVVKARAEAVRDQRAVWVIFHASW